MLQLAAKLGSKTPIIVSCANGIIGRDAVTDEHQEVTAFNIFSSLVLKKDERFYEFLAW